MKQPVISSKCLSPVLHPKEKPGEETLVWELTLTCGHQVQETVRYSDADGPGDQGPHLAPHNGMCPYGCPSPDPQPTNLDLGLPLWLWVTVALLMAAAFLWLVSL